MAKPRVFISSTHYDLKHIRASLDNFIEGIGFEPVRSEAGDIPYDSKTSLDESCYREAQDCDIFVLIISGKYGSPASDQIIEDNDNFYERYESITKREFKSAIERDIPVYICVEKAVFVEFETFKQNEDNESVNYYHVDNIGIFKFLKEIISQRRNNPILQYEKNSEIEEWLKDQWAGMFKLLLSQRSKQREISSLSKEVAELSSVSLTLKRYMEVIVENVSEDKGKEIIEAEKEKLKEDKTNIEFENSRIVKDFSESFGIPNKEMKRIILDSIHFNDFAKQIELASKGLLGEDAILASWKTGDAIIDDFNKLRDMFNKSHFKND